MKKDQVFIIEDTNIGENFIPQSYIKKGKGPHHFRNLQNNGKQDSWRNLKAGEVESLVRNGNTAEDWEQVFVSDFFEANLVKNCSFFGMVRIGNLRNVSLKHHDLILPAGITNSRIISCDIGDNMAIHNVNYLAHYIIGDYCILVNIDEMNTTNHAKFGNGILKDGESEEVRVWMDLMNETATRGVLPFDGMISADAYIWAKFRDNKALMSKLKEITQNKFDSSRGYYGLIGEQTVIKNSRILKDVKIGSMCYIKGANKLKNLTINSSFDEPTQIGEGVEMVNGIVGYRCRVFYGCKAVRFIMGNNTNLKYGARLINSFLGANSTISCCEVLNNLIFPSHEQHHNNSFLVAALIKGQSNIAAGATLGSNHNSRANDNEIIAGRGFWPGLCTSIKHPSKFASFCLLAKADYPKELNITLPFALVNNNPAKDQLEIMPAYWWLYNMYALSRNEYKYQKRDIRKSKTQIIEYRMLAPDTTEEIISGINYLESLLNINKDQRLALLFSENYESFPQNIVIEKHDFENSGRAVAILKPFKAYQAYLQMLMYYSTDQLFKALKENRKAEDILKDIQGKSERIVKWENIGGQLIRAKDLDALIQNITKGKLNKWEKIHAQYQELQNKYESLKYKHAISVLVDIFDIQKTTLDGVKSLLDHYLTIQKLITDRVYESRAKDYISPFKQMIFKNENEMKAVTGSMEDNDFYNSKREELDRITEELMHLKSSLK